MTFVDFNVVTGGEPEGTVDILGWRAWNNGGSTETTEKASRARQLFFDAVSHHRLPHLEPAARQSAFTPASVASQVYFQGAWSEGIRDSGYKGFDAVSAAGPLSQAGPFLNSISRGAAAVQEVMATFTVRSVLDVPCGEGAFAASSGILTAATSYQVNFK